MSDLLRRHQPDLGRATTLDTFSRCVDCNEPPHTTVGITTEDINLMLRESIGLQGLPFTEMLEMEDLVWRITQYRDPQESILLGYEENEKDQQLGNAKGTVVLWHNNLHIAGVNPDSRIISLQYTAEQTGQSKSPLMSLRKAEMSFDTPELDLREGDVERQYKYFISGAECIMTQDVFPELPSHYDLKTDDPFHTAGLVTPRMMQLSQAYHPLLLTLIDKGEFSNLEGVTRGIRNRNDLKVIEHTSGIISVHKGEEPLLELPLHLS